MSPPAHDVVLAANNGDIGGGEVMLLAIARELVALGLRVTVVGPTHPDGVLDEAEAQGHPVIRLAGGRRAYMAELRRWDRGERRGLLWCNGLVPTVATTGHRNRVVHLHRAPDRAQRAAATVARRGALMTIVPSEDLARLVPGSRVMWNWCPQVMVDRRAESDGSYRVGFLGRLSAEKGLVVLADVVRQLSNDSALPPLELVIAGEARFVADNDLLSAERALEPIQGIVHRVGWIEPAEFFARVDVAVFPSLLRETFGLVVAEAMSARVPFVTSDAGALPEVAGPDYPWVAPVGDSSGLASTLRDCLQTPDAERARIVAQAHDRWHRHFSPAAGRDRLREVLVDLGIPATT